MKERQILPPRLRDWTQGKPQIGAFLRTRRGATVQVVNDDASRDQETLVIAITLTLTSDIPSEVLEPLRTWITSQSAKDWSLDTDETKF
jgi:hypothetical protein